MRKLILTTPDNARAVCAALDAADPVGAPYTMIRQLSEHDEELAMVGLHLGWAQGGLVERLSDAARAAGATIVRVRSTPEAELADRGLQFRPELPEEPPIRHADLNEMDLRRGITTTGTIAQRWAQHQEDSKR